MPNPARPDANKAKEAGSGTEAGSGGARRIKNKPTEELAASKGTVPGGGETMMILNVVVQGIDVT